MKISDIAGLLGYFESPWTGEISGIQYDSRRVKTGDLFVCLRGAEADGHNFAAKAVEQGAHALLVEEILPGIDIPQIKVEDTRRALAFVAEAYYEYPGQKLKLLGITGTNGKTTTTHLVKHVLEAYGKKTGLIGTNHILIGDKVIPSTHTTPESLEISAYLREMVEAGCEYAVMEVSSHGLSQGRVAALDFRGAVFTNLTQDHLDYHKDFADYLQAKLLLFRSLGQNGKSAFGVANYDDPYCKDFVAAAKVPVFTFGLEEGADFYGSAISMTPQGTQFDLEHDEKKYRVKIPLLGNFNVYNALAAISLLHGESLPLPFILDALSRVEQVRGRFQKVDFPRGPVVLVDYAHSPDGLINILKTANEIKKKQLILVFGCGGDRDKTKRPIMGKIGGRGSDFSIITSDNPRTEDPNSIIDMVEAGMKETDGEYIIIADRRNAIKEAILRANEEDLVVIAGKGHEDYQIIGREKHHFDDFEEALAALEFRYQKS